MKCPKCKTEGTKDSRFCSHCGAEFAAAKETPLSYTKTMIAKISDLSVGSTFADRYYIMEDLGKGGMGKVFKVLDTKIDEKVALKLLNPDVAFDEHTKERFRNELKMTRKITHPNICRMHDFGEEKGYPYITMEYVPGEDLKNLIKRIGQFTVGKAVFITKQICEGLTAAHKIGIIHRDLKPQNIMIDREGNSHILDFGIARSIKTKGITEAGSIIGTPEYMSPEQVEGKEVDQRSDVYSLGVIFYEMVTGKVPFEGDTPLNVAVKQKTEIPKNPREVNSQVPENVSRVILKCLEKDKNKRYQKTSELLADLKEIERIVPTTDRVLPQRKSITSREITVKFNLRKIYVPVLVVLAVVIMGIMGWKLISNPKVAALDEGKPSLAVMYFENNTGNENLETWRKALSDLLIADLSQSKYLRVLSGEKLLNIMEELNIQYAGTYSSRNIKQVAERGGVKYILVGKMTQAGSTIRINTSLQEAVSGKQIGSEMVEGSGTEDLFEMVDSLTRRVKRSFQLTQEEIAADIDKAVEDITTSSPEAARFYQEGIKSHRKGNYTECIALMELAVGTDSEFAMAYRAMANAYSNLGYQSEAEKNLQQAFDLTDKVSDKERFYIQGQYYMQYEASYDKAIEAYQQLLDLYPDDTIGNNNLALIYMNLEEWEKARELLEGNKSRKVDGIQTYINLSNVNMTEGKTDEAQSVLEFYINNFWDNASIHYSLAHNYLWKGEYNLALVEAEKAFSLEATHYRNFIIKGDIYNYLGDLGRAENEYQNLLKSSEPTANNNGLHKLSALYLFQGRYKEAIELALQGVELAEMLGERSWLMNYYLLLADMYIKTGKPDEALQECARSIKIADEIKSVWGKREAMFFMGLAYLSQGRIDDSQKAADELKVICDNSTNKNLCRYYTFLMARLEQQNGNHSAAIQYMQEALASIPSPYFGKYFRAMIISSLASSYYESGDIDRAIVEYGKLTALPQGRVYWGDIYVKGFYTLGKLYEEKNLETQAINNYNRFLDLWKNADDAHSEIVNAEARIAELQKPESERN